MKKKKKKPVGKKRRGRVKYVLLTVFLLLAAGAAALFWFGTTSEMEVVTYAVESDKLEEPIRLVLVTDLHSCRYGEGQRELLDAIAAQAPDALLLGGDIIDDDIPRANGELFVREAAKAYPTYYVTGNHEFRTEDIQGIRDFMRSTGTVVLDGDCETLTIGDQTIQICGVDDPEYIGQTSLEAQLFQAYQEADPTLFTVLLSHRPELIDLYRTYGFDLILSGHAHGGQWRLPGVLNGLLAPNQGLFPKYAGGRYDFEDCTFIVSRGLARESTRIPRLFNPPELVVLDLS